MSDFQGQSPDGQDDTRILVVDDNEMNRDLLTRRLGRGGFRTGEAAGGREALALLEQEAFDLVLLDIMMPEMDGFEVLGRLKASKDLRDVPVIMISAADDTASVVRCIELGAEDHLPKPFDPTILFARIGSSLAKKRLRDRERIWAKSLERELEIGREIQAGFLPESLPAVDGWEIAAVFHPARQVAGDFYDAFLLPDGRRVALVMADVCGKGVSAALFMALFRSLVRILLVQRFADPGTPAADGLGPAIGSVSDYVVDTHGRTGMFATMFAAVLDPTAGVLTYVNAGHDPPVVIDENRGVVATLKPTGAAAGLIPGFRFGVETAPVAPGQTLLTFTDGVGDARDPTGKAFGQSALLRLLEQPVSSATALLNAVETAVTQHAAGAEPFDDITLLAVRRLPG